MFPDKEQRRRESKKAERHIEFRFYSSIAILLGFTIVLVSSLASFPNIFVPLKSFLLVLTILFAYFAIIPILLKSPPFFSTFALRHNAILDFVGAMLLLATICDLVSGFFISVSIQKAFSSIGLPMSDFLLSNITYVITLVTGAFSYIVKKSRQKVQVDLQWYSKLLGSFKSKAYLPPPKMMKKGYPIQIYNRSTDPLEITNIRLTTIIGSPFVPYSITKAFLSESPTLSITMHADEEIELPKKIAAADKDIVYIPWKTIKSAAQKLSERVDFSNTVAMSYFRLHDEFSGQEWSTPIFHILNPLFVSNISAILRTAKDELQKQ